MGLVVRRSLRRAPLAGLWVLLGATAACGTATEAGGTRPTPTGAPAHDRAQRSGVVLLLDVSGSSEQQGEHALRESCVTSLDALLDDDWLAVIVFNHAVRTLIPPGPVRASRSAGAGGTCASIVAKGGTEFVPALGEAHRTALAMPVTRRTVVLLTDGRGPTEGVTEALDSLRSDGIVWEGLLLPASIPADPLRALLLAQPGVSEVEEHAVSEAIRDALRR